MNEYKMCPNCGLNLVPQEPVELDGFWVDPVRYKAKYRGEFIHLTVKQIDIMGTLFIHPDIPSRPEAMLNRLESKSEDIKTIDVFVWKLRQRLLEFDPEHSYIQTVRGLGYIWEKRKINAVDTVSSCDDN